MSQATTLPDVETKLEGTAPGGQPPSPENAAQRPWEKAASEATGARIPELDGLRGMAISLVVAYHFFDVRPAGGFRFEGVFQGLYAAVANCVAMGWSGVDLFFVLSGFLIGGILLEKRDSPRYFRAFYARRFFRIVPLYYTWMAVFIASALVLAWVKPLSSAAQFEWRTVGVQLLFLQNFRPLAYGTFAALWLSVTWSLAVEEQFYLLSPMLVRRVSEKALCVVLVLVALAAPVFRLWVRGASDEFGWAGTLLPSRAEGLCIGMLCASLWKEPGARSWLRQRAGVIRFAAAIFAAGTFLLAQWSPVSDTLAVQSLGFTWIDIFCGLVLMLALASPAGMLGAITRLGVMRELGRVSYCLYLIHFPVYFAIAAALRSAAGPLGPVANAAAGCVAIVAAYGIARLSWTYFERPLLARGHTVRY